MVRSAAQSAVTAISAKARARACRARRTTAATSRSKRSECLAELDGDRQHEEQGEQARVEQARDLRRPDAPHGDGREGQRGRGREEEPLEERASGRSDARAAVRTRGLICPPRPRTVRSQVAIQAGPVSLEKVPVHRRGHELAFDLARPVRKLPPAECRCAPAAGRPAPPPGAAPRRLPSHSMSSRAACGCFAPATRPDGVVDDRRAGRREDTREGRPALLLEEHVGQVPERDEALAPADLLEEEGGVDDVLLRLAVEPLRATRSRARGPPVSAIERIEDHPEDRAHRAGGERIADQDLSLQSAASRMSSQSRGASRGGDRGRVVDDDGGRAVEAEVEVARRAAFRRNRARPGRPVRREQAVAGAAREDRVGPAEPDVRLRVRLLRADPVVDLLRAHVEPPHVHVRMLRLVGLLDERRAGRGRAGSRGRRACARPAGRRAGRPRPPARESSRGLSRAGEV